MTSRKPETKRLGFLTSFCLVWKPRSSFAGFQIQRTTSFLLYLFIVIFFLFCPSFCQEMPKDVPPDHYAYDAISDLVDRGINVSQGYPDGTFRGSRKTSRYENAYFMASLALNLRKTASVETDFSDIREEISYLRGEIMSVKQNQESSGALKYHGSVELKSKFGSVVSYNQYHREPLGPETNYRFKYSIEKNLGEDASLKLNLDTMDGAFNSATLRTFPAKLLDFEGDISLDVGLENPLKIKAIFGPGSVVHRDTSGVVPSDDYTYYARPRPTFMAGTVLGDWNVAGAYACRGVQANGAVGTSEINLQLARKIGILPVLGTAEFTSTSRYVFIDLISPTSMPNDFKQELSLLMTQSKELSEKLLVGSSSTDNPSSQYYLNFELYLKNLYGRGTNVNFFFNSLGMNYRLPFDKLEFVPLNLFNRKILDGMVDIGLEVSVPLSENAALKNKSELVFDNFGKIDRDAPGSSFTHEISLDFNINKDFMLNSYYRYYFVPSRTGQFSETVPEESDLFGLGLIYKF